MAKLLLSLLLLISALVTVFAVDQLTFRLNDEQSLGPSSELRLIQTSETVPPTWLAEEQKLELLRLGVKFMDITDHRDLGQVPKPVSRDAFPLAPSHGDEVKAYIANLTTENMKADLTRFTKFYNRYYKSTYGAKSSKWLFQTIKTIVSENSYEDVVTVTKFKHKWAQFSIIARFNGTEESNRVIIIGAHQDSVNMWFPYFGRAPGADDDGSGTVTILEAFRTLVKGHFRPTIPVEFHWYSGEEGGLLGSQAIANVYEHEGREVVAMLQNDMTGYITPGYPESFGIVVDYVDPGLTDFVKKLIKEYALIPAKDTKCGYACSDHASWRKAGYPSAFAIESEFEDSNPHIHTSDDAIKYLSFDHMLEFSKLSVSLAIELSYT